MNSNSVTLLDSAIEGSCRSLFEAVGAAVETAGTHIGSPDDVGASIGFTGAALKGALVLISTRRFIQKVLPPEVVADDLTTHIADWTGELTNQLLGRIKNKLFSYGVILEMSTPTVIFGLELVRKNPRSSVSRRFTFQSGADMVSVYFDAVAGPNFELSVPDQPPGSTIAEGELALF